jgi:hypothetical protein
MGFTYNQHGIAICHTNYVVDKLLALALAPKIWAPHPWYIGLYNSIGEMQIKFDAVFATISCVYRGYFFMPNVIPDPTYEFIDAGTAQPIDTNPRFTAPAAEGGLGGTKATQNITDPTAPYYGAVFNNDGRFAGFTPDAHDNLGGIKSWIAPSAIWRATYIYNSWFDLTTIGKVEVPDGPVPNLPSPQDWLFYSVTQRRQGNAYQVSKEWRASDPGAYWNTLIYNYY